MFSYHCLYVCAVLSFFSLSLFIHFTLLKYLRLSFYLSVSPFLFRVSHKMKITSVIAAYKYTIRSSRHTIFYCKTVIDDSDTCSLCLYLRLLLEMRCILHYNICTFPEVREENCKRELKAKSKTNRMNGEQTNEWAN